MLAYAATTRIACSGKSAVRPAHYGVCPAEEQIVVVPEFLTRELVGKRPDELLIPRRLEVEKTGFEVDAGFDYRRCHRHLEIHEIGYYLQNGAADSVGAP